ncbi:MAG: leucine-rich repeat protein [Oscillospiraceae bacterium]
MKKPSKKFQIVEDTLIKYTGKDTEVIIPVGVKIIGSNAFENNNYVQSIILPDQLEIIEEDAFVNCNGLSKISFETLNIQIDKNWFDNCYCLEIINIRKMAISINDCNYYGNITLNVEFITKMIENDEQFIRPSINGLISQQINPDKTDKIIKRLIKNQKDIIKGTKSLKSFFKRFEMSEDLPVNVDDIIEVAKSNLEVTQTLKSCQDEKTISWIHDKLNTLFLQITVLSYNLEYEQENINEDDLEEMYNIINENILKLVQNGIDLLDELQNMQFEAMLQIGLGLQDMFNDDDDNNDDENNNMGKPHFNIFQ